MRSRRRRWFALLNPNVPRRFYFMVRRNVNLRLEVRSRCTIFAKVTIYVFYLTMPAVFAVDVDYLLRSSMPTVKQSIAGRVRLSGISVEMTKRCVYVVYATSDPPYAQTFWRIGSSNSSTFSLDKCMLLGCDEHYKQPRECMLNALASLLFANCRMGWDRTGTHRRVDALNYGSWQHNCAMQR